MKTSLLKATKRNLLKAALAIICTATLLIPAKVSAEDSHGLVGVWRVTRHGVNCQTGQELNSFPALMTFHDDGTVLGEAVGPAGNPSQGTSEMGVWSRRGREHSFHLTGYGSDGNGNVTGIAEITGNLQLTGPNSFVYSATICFYDPAGNKLFCFCGRAEGTRFE